MGGALEISRASALVCPRHPLDRGQPCAGQMSHSQPRGLVGCRVSLGANVPRTAGSGGERLAGWPEPQHSAEAERVRDQGWRRNRPSVHSSSPCFQTVWPEASGLTSLSLSFLLCKMGFIFPEKRRGLGIDEAWGTGSKKGDAPESQLETNRTKSLVKRSDGSNSRWRLSTSERLSKHPTGCKAQL